MSRVAPLEADSLDAQSRAQIEFAERLMGFRPNDALVMARRPALLKAMGALVDAAYGEGRVDAGLKRLIGGVFLLFRPRRQGRAGARG